MSSDQISLSLYGIFVQRVVIPNTCKSQQKYNSHIENNPLNFERFIRVISEHRRLFTVSWIIIWASI